MLIAVIGDVHANARALGAALDETERRGFDLRVLTGDVLTYGIDVMETLDLVSDALSKPRTLLLRGNHDQAYDMLLSGRETDIAGWVRRHLEWTLGRMSATHWRSLPFKDQHTAAGIFFAHANPFGRYDWSYLNDEREHARAAARLGGCGLRAGVFGHTHRPRLYDVVRAAFLPTDTAQAVVVDGTAVANAGSVGQPRGSSPREVVLWIEADVAEVSYTFVPLVYDVAAHRRAISESSLPVDLRERCLSYFPLKVIDPSKNSS